MSLVEPGTASVDADNPWLGLASFTEESQTYFFGREAEVAELTRRVQRKLLTVLFGKSGLGKTSILRAGLVPHLREHGYFPVYLRIDYGRDSPEPSEQIKQEVNRAARDLHSTGIEGVAAAESIWEFLHHRQDVLKDASGSKLIPLLIFDQFEELFTLAQTDEFGRSRAARFTEELADLVENRAPRSLEAKLDADEGIAEGFDFSRSDYRVVIALREDYLAALESLKKLMPSLSQNRLRLAPMTGRQALQAVLRPGRKLVSEEVAEAIVRFVAGGSELQNAEVEPSLLSLICRELNEQRIAQARNEISQDLLAGSHETILSSFYERSLADQPESVRRIIEDDLLTESGYRENLAEESLLKRFQVAGAAPDALAKLVNRRLLRIEERLDVRRVELTHDVLTGVVKSSRDQRHEREAREATERTLAQQRERELAARRALRRVRTIATGCTLLAVVAIVAAGAAFLGVQRARRAEQLAHQTRAISEQSRQQAEGLLGFLTDDFVTELETFGRYQTIAELSEREIDYFQRLPPDLENPQTLRSGALALVNHALAEEFIGNTVTAGNNATQAVALMEQLRRVDRSDATALVLGRAYSRLGDVLDSREDFAKGDLVFQQALDLIRPIAERPNAPAAARRTYLATLNSFGIESTNSGSDRALGLMRQALSVAAGLGAPHSADVTVNAQYARALGMLATALMGLGRDEQARHASEQSLVVADAILMQHPQYGEVQLTKQGDGQTGALAARDQLDPAAARRFAMLAAQAALAIYSIEPGNTLYANQLANSYGIMGAALQQQGQLREALIYYRKSLENYGKATGFAYGFTNLVFLMPNLVSQDAQLGDFSAAQADIDASEAFLSPSQLRKLGPARPGAETLLNAVRATTAATMAYERGDFSAARHIAHSAIGAIPVQVHHADIVIEDLADVEARADYALNDFAAAAAADATAARFAYSASHGHSSYGRTRTIGQIDTWLSMSFAREGKLLEAARTIAPVVQQYRDLEKKNHGDQWLPLEFAATLYAQALSDAPHRAALLREALQRIDHLVPAIANLHDTREWRRRIEAQR